MTPMESAIALAYKEQTQCLYHYTIEDDSVRVEFWIRFEEDGLRLLWNTTKLGSEYPEDNVFLTIPMLIFTNIGTGKQIELHLIPSKVSGINAYPSQRGAHMPRLPFTMRFGLPIGSYTVTAKYEAQQIGKSGVWQNTQVLGELGDFWRSSWMHFSVIAPVLRVAVEGIEVFDQ
ncbi:MAG: hypothetical protein QG641_490 [Candidatus Poribacteria bacterium]|nr:hypothetical protein [Candidatus Poribacteria bacterium]